MLKYITLIFALAIASPADAACDHLYPSSKKIAVKDTVELCNTWYVSVYNEKMRSVYFVSEVLDFNNNGQERGTTFKTDRRVKNPVSQREYIQSGWDKGHLAPAGDATTPVEMAESFLMTNTAPQNPTLNRGQWRKLETYIRSKVAKDKLTVHVVTGVILGTDKLTSNVPIPTYFFKIIYFPGKTEAWMAKNEAAAKAVRVDLNAIRASTKIDF